MATRNSVLSTTPADLATFHIPRISKTFRLSGTLALCAAVIVLLLPVEAEAQVLPSDTVHILQARDGVLRAVFSPDERYVIVNTPTDIDVYDLSADASIAHFTLPANPTRQVIPLADGVHLMSAGPDSVRVWDWHTGQMLWASPAREGGASVSGGVAALDVGDREVRYVRLADAALLETVDPVSVRSLYMSLDSSGNRLATFDSFEGVRVYDRTAKASIFNSNGRRFDGGNLSPDGHKLVAYRSGVIVFNVDTGDTLVALKAAMQFRQRSAAFDPTGKFIATIGKDTGTFDSHVRIWDASTGELIHHLGVHGIESSWVTYSPSGKWIASVSDSSIRIWPVPAISAVEASPRATAGNVSLAAYPDPASDQVVAHYIMSAPGAMDLALLNSLGIQVLSVEHAAEEAGEHQAMLDTRALPSGVYFLRLRAAGHETTRTVRVQH